MAILYEVCPQEVHDRIDRLIEKHHKDLHENNVDVRAIFAVSTKIGQDAVKLHGYKCAAIVKKVGIRERAQGLSDALIIIDKEFWEKLGEDGPEGDVRRDALIDHELTHLQVSKDDDGEVKKDVLGRPMLEMRLHDWELGGFAEIADRYGADALEREQVRVCVNHWGQSFWEFGAAPRRRTRSAKRTSRKRGTRNGRADSTAPTGQQILTDIERTRSS